jgi:hypothetical protein
MRIVWSIASLLVGAAVVSAAENPTKYDDLGREARPPAAPALAPRIAERPQGR